MLARRCKLEKTKVCDTKAEAERQAAMAGVRHLLSIGVLDDSFEVVGRSDAIRKLRERACGSSRTSTRANRRALARKEPVVRSLPALLHEPPVAAPDGSLRVWCHPLILDGTPSGVALLLPAECPEPARSFVGSGPDGRRLAWCLDTPAELRLSAGQLRDVATWLVGSLDIIQAHSPCSSYLSRLHTCHMSHLPYATPTICHTWHMSHPPYVTPTICHTCHMSHPPYVTPAICHTCHMSHLPYVTPAICHTRHMSHPPYVTPAICHTHHM